MSTAVFLYQAAIVGSVWWLTWGQGFVGYLLVLIFWSAFTFFRAMTPKLKLIQGTVILASAAVFAEAAYIDLLLTVEKNGIFVVVGISFVATVVLTLAFNWLSGVVYANMAKRIDDVHDFAELPRFNYENVKEVVKSGTLSACGISDVLDTRAPVYLKAPFEEKDEVRELGAKWDPSRREWYVPPGVDLGGFERWMPQWESDGKQDELSLNERIERVRQYNGGRVSDSLLETALDFMISIEPDPAEDFSVYELAQKKHEKTVAKAELIFRRYGEQIRPLELSRMQNVFYSITNSEKYGKDMISCSVARTWLSKSWHGIGEWRL